MVRVTLLMGGLFSTDGVITSVGMNTLFSMLEKLPNTMVKSYLWGNIEGAYRDIKNQQPSDKTAVIGYSGGGMSASWLANTPYNLNMDLMVLYDPSPSWNIKPIGPNVKKAICYHNKSQMFIPFVGWIGGGVLKGPQVETIDIDQNHLAVQFNQDLHSKTVEYVRALA